MKASFLIAEVPSILCKDTSFSSNTCKICINSYAIMTIDCKIYIKYHAIFTVGYRINIKINRWQ